METTDRIETRLVDIETTIGRLRAIQIDLLAEIDRRQTPLADGCRTLSEWVCSRLDVAPETGRLLSRMGHETIPRLPNVVERSEGRSGIATNMQGVQMVILSSANWG